MSRREGRISHKVLFHCDLSSILFNKDNKPLRALLIDISQYGLGIATYSPHHVDDILTLLVSGDALRLKIVWARKVKEPNFYRLGLAAPTDQSVFDYFKKHNLINLNRGLNLTEALEFSTMSAKEVKRLAGIIKRTNQFPDLAHPHNPNFNSYPITHNGALTVFMVAPGIDVASLEKRNVEFLKANVRIIVMRSKENQWKQLWPTDESLLWENMPTSEDPKQLLDEYLALLEKMSIEDQENNLWE
jgi:hypothetical protein